MHRQRIITFLLALLIAQIAASQDVLNGIVLDKETQEPIVGATVSDGSKGKPLAVTAADGRFRLPKNNYAKLKISYIGYKTLITVPSKDGRYLLQAEISRIGRGGGDSTGKQRAGYSLKDRETRHGASATFQFYGYPGIIAWWEGSEPFALGSEHHQPA